MFYFVLDARPYALRTRTTALSVPAAYLCSVACAWAHGEFVQSSLFSFAPPNLTCQVHLTNTHTHLLRGQLLPRMDCSLLLPGTNAHMAHHHPSLRGFHAAMRALTWQASRC